MRQMMRCSSALLLIVASGCGNDASTPSETDIYCTADEATFQQLPLTDPPPEGCPLRPKCPHNGGDQIHDECADRVPPNIVWGGMLGGTRGTNGQGCDVEMVGQNRLFDALSWDSRMKNWMLWEIKTADWSNIYRYRDEDCRMRILVNEINLFIEDCRKIMTCNVGVQVEEDKLRYTMGIADEGLYHAVSDFIAANPAAVRNKLPTSVTDDFKLYCLLNNVQSCRRPSH